MLGFRSFIYTQLRRRIASLEAMLAAGTSNHRQPPPDAEPEHRDSTRRITLNHAANVKSTRIPGTEETDTDSVRSSSSDDEQALGETYGTLAIDTNGNAKFVGSLAGSAYLQDYHGDEEQTSRQPSASPIPQTSPNTAQRPECRQSSPRNEPC